MIDPEPLRRIHTSPAAHLEKPSLDRLLRLLAQRIAQRLADKGAVASRAVSSITPLSTDNDGAASDETV